MPRPLRIEFEDACYHVMNRGRGRQRVFHAKAYYDAFLNTLAEAHRRFGAILHAYCLMDNHYHLLIETPEGNLSRGMRELNGRTTQAVNRRHRLAARPVCPPTQTRPSALQGLCPPRGGRA